ncbi:hypothetical protein K501DRAFT_330783 [Backusella circina FSU 941]|nr:hypothetical protein K501DRAFT_330783 [Backusella circina FSU 941]
MSASPERRSIEEIMRNTPGSPTRESHFMTPTRSILSTPKSYRIPTDPRRISFSGDQALRLFADDTPSMTNMSQESEPSNLFRSVLAEDYQITSIYSTNDGQQTSTEMTNIQSTVHIITEVEDENEQGDRHHHQDEDSGEEEEEEDDDMRITEQLAPEPSTLYHYDSPNQTPLDGIPDPMEIPSPPSPPSPPSTTFESTTRLDHQPEMTMSAFLKVLSIDTQLPDMEPPKRRSIPFTASTPTQDLVAQLYTLPMLAAFKEKSRELDEWIRQAKIQSDIWDQQAETREPRLISDYRSASYTERSPFRESMGKVREWEEVYAETECVKDHVAFLEGMHFRGHLETMLKEKIGTTSELKQKSVSKLEKSRLQYAKVKKLYDEALMRERESVDHHRAIELITELKELQTVNDNYTKEISEYQEKQVALDEEIVGLDRQKAKLMKEIEQHAFTIEKSTPATKQDLKRIYDYYNLLTTRAGLKAISHDDGVLVMDIHNELSVAIDEKKLIAQQQSGAVEITVKPEIMRGDLALWCKGLKPLVENKWEVTKIVESLFIYWNRVILLRHELECIQRRFVTEIKPVMHDDDPSKCGVVWGITLFDFESRTKIYLALEICVNEIVRHPKMDSAKVNAMVEDASHITQVQLDDMVYKLIEERGLANISSTVADILKKASVPQ